MSMGIAKWFVGLGIVIFMLLMALLGRDTSSSISTKEQLHEFKNTIHIKLLAELEEGPYLHRVIDSELGKVCYLNAVGGGIQCFSLDEVTSGKDAEAIKKLTRRYRKPSRYNY